VRGVAAIGHYFLVDKGGLGTVSIVELENILRWKAQQRINGSSDGRWRYIAIVMNIRSSEREKKLRVNEQ